MNDAVVFPYCRSVIPIEDNKTDSIDTSPFLVSGPQSWAERNTQSVYDGKVSFDADKDLKGPVSVGLIVGTRSTETAGSLIVMGDSDFAADHYFDVLGNKDLFLNTVNWLAGKEKLISTRGKATQTPISILFLTENESRLVFWSSVIVEPGIVLLFGLMVVIWRRIKRG
jgi:hypothetical protein